MFFKNFTNKIVSIMLAGVVGFSPIIAVAAEENIFVIDNGSTTAIEMDGVKYLDAETDGVAVRVSATQEALGEGIDLSISSVDYDSEEYDAILEALSVYSISNGKSILGARAINLKLVDGDGNCVDPTDSLGLKISYSDGAAPDLAPTNEGQVFFARMTEDLELLDCEMVKDDQLVVDSVQAKAGSLGTFVLYWADNASDSGEAIAEMSVNRYPTEFEVECYNALVGSSGNNEKLTGTFLPSKVNIEVNKNYDFYSNDAIKKIVSDGTIYELKKVTFQNGSQGETEIKGLKLNKVKNTTYFYSYIDANGNTMGHSGWSQDNLKNGLKFYYEKSIYLTGASLVDYNPHINDGGYVEPNKGALLFNYGNGREDWNLYHSNKGRYVYQGIASNTMANGFRLSDSMSNRINYFPAEGEQHDYVSECHNNVDVRFVIDSDGYYILDSSKYRYDLNRNTKTLDINPNTNGYDQKFLPFKENCNRNDGNDEYHFGMNVPFTFSISEDGKIEGQPIEFSFVGDDDVFVYIDNKLVLDLGGIHGQATGIINFSNFSSNAVNIPEGVYNPNDPGSLGQTYSLESIFPGDLKKFANTEHTMNVIFFERGKNMSNCKIKYNFVPINVPDSTNVSFTKVDETTNQALEGATFELYSEENSSFRRTAVSGYEGITTFLSVPVGNYVFKEVANSDGRYLLPEGAKWNLSVASGWTLDSTITPANDIAAAITSGDGKNITIKNKKADSKSITIKKSWQSVDSIDDLPESISFNIRGSINKNKQQLYLTKDYELTHDASTVFKTVTIEKSKLSSSLDWKEWTYQVNDLLDKFNGVDTIEWSFEEEKVPGFFIMESKLEDGVFSITNTKATSTEKPLDLKEIDKTATADGGRDAIIELNVLEGQQQITYLKERKPGNVVLVLDASKSMSFPSDLVECNISDVNKLDKGKTYYFVSNDSAATVYRLWHGKDKGWLYADASNQNASGTAYTEKLASVFYMLTTGKTRVEYLIEAGKNLVNILPDGSRVSLIIFSQDAKIYNFNKSGKIQERFDESVKVIYENNTIKEQNILSSLNESQLKPYVATISSDKSKEEIKSAIAELNNMLNSRTRQDLGLESAKDVIEHYYLKNSATKDLDTSVILLTDGCPNVSGGNSSYKVGTRTIDAVANAKDYANSLKNQGLNIFTVGIDLELNDQMESAKKLMTDCASESASGEKYCYNAASSDLVATFANVATTITDGTVEYTYKTGNVVDILDERFDLVVFDANGNEKVITNDASSIANNTDGGYVDIDGKRAKLTLTDDEKGLLKITWENQPLGEVVESVNTGNKWTAKFRIRAKQDFLGGNKIPTNDPESGVYVPDEEPEKFPQPSVNVEEMRFDLGDDEEILFVGEKITDVYDFKSAINAIIATVKNKGNADIDYSQVLAIDSITDEAIKKPSLSDINSDMFNKYVITKPYSYGDTKDLVGQIQYILTISRPEQYALNISNDEYIASNETGAPTEVYTLTIKYDPLATVDRKRNDIKDAANTDQEQSLMSTNEGHYYVSIIDGAAKLTKRGDSNKVLAGAKYGLYKDGGLVTTQVSNENGLISLGHIPYGKTYVKEIEAPIGYALSDDEYLISVEAGADNTKNTGVYKLSASLNEETLAETSVNKALYSQLNKPKQDEVSTTTAVEPIAITFDVTDIALAELPQTGGSGTYIYTISGLLLISAALLFLYIKKRRIKRY